MLLLFWKHTEICRLFFKLLIKYFVVVYLTMTQATLLDAENAATVRERSRILETSYNDKKS